MPLALGTLVLRPGVPAPKAREFVCRMIRYFPGWASLLLLFGAFLIGTWFMHLAREGSIRIIVVTPPEGLLEEAKE